MLRHQDSLLLNFVFLHFLGGVLYKIQHIIINERPKSCPPKSESRLYYSVQSSRQTKIKEYSWQAMIIFHIIGTVSFILIFREHSVCCISQMPNEKRNTESRKIDCPAFATITEIIRWVKPNVSHYTYVCMYLPIPLCHKIN